jgi:DNA-binding GntR family transcriptional regulator
MRVGERLPKETARDYAMRVIVHNIISLDLEPGSMVSENELSLELGVSRTPIREALLELCKSRIIDVLPQKGSRVALIDYDIVEESRFLRFVLETTVVEIVAETSSKLDFSKLTELLDLQYFYLQNGNPAKLLELDDQFHSELFRLCNKEWTFSIIHSTSTHFDRVRSMSLNTLRDTKIVEDHDAILRALKSGSAPNAKKLMTKHLTRYKIDEEAIRSKYPDYFK